MDHILAKQPRFNPAIVILGYFLSCIGLTMLFRPDLRSLMITGAAGILVGSDAAVVPEAAALQPAAAGICCDRRVDLDLLV